MAITIRGHNLTTNIGNSGGTVSLPVTANAGDLILVHTGIHNSSATTTVTATGYSSIDVGGNDSNGAAMVGIYKVAAGGETTVAITIGGGASGGNNSCQIIVIATGGFNASTPINAHTKGSTGAATSGPALSLTTTVDHCALVYAWDMHNTQGTLTVPSNPNTSWVKEDSSTTPLDPVAIYWNPDAGTAGSTGTVQPTDSVSSNGHGAILYAITPAIVIQNFTQTVSGVISSGNLASSLVREGRTSLSASIASGSLVGVATKQDRTASIGSVSFVGPLLKQTRKRLDDPSLIACWQFEDGSGTTVKDSAGSNDGTWHGTLGSQWGTGKLGGGGIFNSTDNCVAMPTDVGHFGMGSKFSAAAWIYVAPDGNHHYIIGNATGFGDSDGWHIRVAQTNVIRFIFFNSAGNSFLGRDSATVSTGWHFVVGVYHGDLVAPDIYLDGSLSNSGVVTSATLTTITNTGYTTIGGNAAFAGWFNGTIDEVGLWNRELSATEISSLYNSGSGKRYGGASVSPQGTLTREYRTFKVLAGVLAPAGVLLHLLIKSFTGAITPTGTATRSGAQQAVVGVLSFTGTSAKRLLRALVGVLSFVGAFLARGQKSLSGATTPSSTLGRSLFIHLAGAISPTSMLHSFIVAHLAGSLTSASTLVKRYTTAFVGSITPTSTITRSLSKLTFTGSISPTSSINDQVRRVLAGSLAFSGALVRSIVTSLLGSLTPTAVQVHLIGRSVTGQTTPQATLTPIKTALLSLLGTVLPNGTLLGKASKGVLGSLSPVGAIQKVPVEHLVGILSPGGLASKKIIRSLIGATTPSGTTAHLPNKLTGQGILFPMGGITQRSIARVLAGSLSFIGIEVRRLLRQLAGALTPTATVSFRPARKLTGSLSPIADLVRAISMPRLGGVVTPVGLTVKLLNSAIEGAITPSGAFSTLFVKTIDLAGSLTSTALVQFLESVFLDGQVTPLGDLLRDISIVDLVGTILPTGTLIAAYPRFVDGQLNFAGAVLRTLAYNLAGVLNSVGTIISSWIRPQALVGVLSFVGSIPHPMVGRSLLGFIQPTARRTRQMCKQLLGAVVPTGVGEGKQALVLVGLVTPTGQMGAFSIKRFLTGLLTPSGLVTKMSTRVTGGLLTPTGASFRSTLKVFAGSVSPIAVTLPVGQKILSGTLPTQGTLFRSIRSLHLGNLLPRGTLAGLGQKALRGTVTPTGVLSKRDVALLRGTLAPSGVLVRLKTMYSILSGLIQPSGLSVSVDRRALVGTLSTSGQVASWFSKLLSGQTLPQGALLRQSAKSVSGVVLPLGVFRPTMKRTLAGVILPTGTQKGSFLSVISGTIRPSGTRSFQTLVLMEGLLTPSGQVHEVLAMFLEGLIDPTGEATYGGQYSYVRETDPFNSAEIEDGTESWFSHVRTITPNPLVVQAQKVNGSGVTKRTPEQRKKLPIKPGRPWKPRSGSSTTKGL